MSIVINTPNGHVGSVVADRLIDAGEHVVLLTRSADRVTELADRGATVYEGNLEDLSFVKDATRGCEVLFWATPQNYAHRKLIWFQNQLGKNAARAVKANAIPYVLNISSIGARLAVGTGVIQGLREVERMLDRTDAAVLHMRASYFMENYCHSLRTIRSDGAVYLPVDGSAEVNMVATRDIAVEVADLMAGRSWSGHTVREIVGPERLTFDEAAAVLGDVIGREVRHIQVSAERARMGMVRMGWSLRSAELVADMYGALAEGKLVPQDVPLVAPTSLKEFAQRKLVEELAAQA
jgi:uncharacterized protein YbjT (DUF2867 family)